MSMGKVVHFEIPADDLARAKDFYGSIFGWKLQTMSMGESDYTMVETTSVDEQTRMPTEPGAINGGMVQRSAETSAPVITIAVEAIDDVLKQIEAAGGSVVKPRSPIPDMGAFAYFTDTEGNVMGLWESA
jgi:predicted enzyme related to lactoylglutathione lyase